jgi:hypothetical protein
VIAKKLLQVLKPPAAVSSTGDPYFSAVSLLLHMDGTNGSTTFVDSGPNAFAITRYGTASISTTQSKFSGTSGYIDGSGARLGLSSTAIDFGTGDFTAECWIYLNSNPSSAYGQIMGKHVYGVSASWILQLNTARVLSFLWNDGANILSTATSLNLGQWYHVAASRSGSTLRIYIDGSQVASTTISYTFSSSTEFTIGSSSNDISAARINAYIDDVRLTKGVARTISVPTAAFPDLYNPYTTLPVSGAALWLSAPQASSLYTDAGATNVIKAGDAVYQWNDLSGNNRHATQTTSGNRPTWVAPASGRNGLGAIAFNGSQWHSVASPQVNFGTGDFTIEFWIKSTNTSVLKTPLGTLSSGFDGGWQIVQNNSKFGFGIGVGGGVETYDATITANTWYHFAVCRSGSTLKTFLNGVNGSTITNSSNISQTGTLNVGWANESAQTGRRFSGEIQNLLIYKGQALYTSNFTPWMS